VSADDESSRGHEYESDGESEAGNNCESVCSSDGGDGSLDSTRNTGNVEESHYSVSFVESAVSNGVSESSDREDTNEHSGSVSADDESSMCHEHESGGESAAGDNCESVCSSDGGDGSLDSTLNAGDVSCVKRAVSKSSDEEDTNEHSVSVSADDESSRGHEYESDGESEAGDNCESVCSNDGGRSVEYHESVYRDEYNSGDHHDKSSDANYVASVRSNEDETDCNLCRSNSLTESCGEKSVAQDADRTLSSALRLVTTAQEMTRDFSTRLGSVAPTCDVDAAVDLSSTSRDQLRRKLVQLRDSVKQMKQDQNDLKECLNEITDMSSTILQFKRLLHTQALHVNKTSRDVDEVEGDGSCCNVPPPPGIVSIVSPHQEKPASITPLSSGMSNKESDESMPPLPDDMVMVASPPSRPYKGKVRHRRHSKRSTSLRTESGDDLYRGRSNNDISTKSGSVPNRNLSQACVNSDQLAPTTVAEGLPPPEYSDIFNGVGSDINGRNGEVDVPDINTKKLSEKDIEGDDKGVCESGSFCSDVFDKSVIDAGDNGLMEDKDIEATLHASNGNSNATIVQMQSFDTCTEIHPSSSSPLSPSQKFQSVDDSSINEINTENLEELLYPSNAYDSSHRPDILIEKPFTETCWSHVNDTSPGSPAQTPVDHTKGVTKCANIIVEAVPRDTSDQSTLSPRSSGRRGKLKPRFPFVARSSVLNPFQSPISEFFEPYLHVFEFLESGHRPETPGPSTDSATWRLYDEKCLLWTLFQCYSKPDGVIATHIRMTHLLKMLRDAGLVKATKVSNVRPASKPPQAGYSQTGDSISATKKPCSVVRISARRLELEIEKLLAVTHTKSSQTVTASTASLLSFCKFTEVVYAIIPLCSCRVRDQADRDADIRDDIVSRDAVMYRLYDLLTVESNLPFSPVLSDFDFVDGLPSPFHDRGILDLLYSSKRLSSSSNNIHASKPLSGGLGILERNIEQFKQLFSYYSQSVHRTPSTASVGASITAAPATSRTKKHNRSMVDLDSCREMLQDFDIYPGLLDNKTVLAVFRHTKCWEWRSMRTEAAQYTDAESTSNDLDSVVSRQHSSQDCINSTYSMDLTLRGFIELMVRVAIMIYGNSNNLTHKAASSSQQLRNKSDKPTLLPPYISEDLLSTAMSFMLRLMDQSSGKKKIMSSNRRSVSIRKFVYR